MKKVHLYEVKLINGTLHRGEIIFKDDRVIWLRLLNSQRIRVSFDKIMSIKDLGWQEIKKSMD